MQTRSRRASIPPARAYSECMAAVVLLSSAALVLGACPAAPAVQDDLSALQPYTAFVDGGGSVHVTPWHDATTPSLQLYEGTDQAVLLFDPTFVPSPPVNRVHLRVVSSSACHCTGATAAGITFGGLVTTLSSSNGSPMHTNSAGNAAAGVRVTLPTGFYKARAPRTQLAYVSIHDGSRRDLQPPAPSLVHAKAPSPRALSLSLSLSPHASSPQPQIRSRLDTLPPRVQICIALNNTAPASDDSYTPYTGALLTVNKALPSPPPPLAPPRLPPTPPPTPPPLPPSSPPPPSPVVPPMPLFAELTPDTVRPSTAPAPEARPPLRRARTRPNRPNAPYPCASFYEYLAHRLSEWLHDVGVPRLYSSPAAWAAERIARQPASTGPMTIPASRSGR